VTILVLGVQGSLAEQSNGDADCTEQHRLAAPNSVENKQDENEIGERSKAVVDTSDENAGFACNTQVFVHDVLIVVNDVDSSHLSQYLDSNAVSIALLAVVTVALIEFEHTASVFGTEEP
jgi:hypothetical protein